MLDFYILVIIIMAGFLTNYMILLSIVKRVRNNDPKRLPTWEIIASGIFFGGPLMIFFYIFPEYREVDQEQKKAFLISGIILTILQILLVFLLLYFNVFKF